MFEFEENSKKELTKVWVEKYRPKTVKECILPPRLQQQFNDMVKAGDITNLHLTGSPGTGKTTIARALCHDLGVDYIIINMSNDSGIETVRTTIVDYISKASISKISKKFKVVILDEICGASQNAMKSLKGLIEKYSDTTRFILTSNYKDKVQPALQSRCQEFNFAITAKERDDLIPAVAMRVTEILTNEGVLFEEEQFEQIINVVDKYYPDIRNIIGKFDTYSKSGSLNQFIDVATNSDLTELVGYLQSKNFAKCLEWIVNNPHDLVSIYDLKNGLYPLIKPIMANKSQIPDLISILGDGNKHLYSCVDQNLQAAETCALIFTTLEF